MSEIPPPPIAKKIEKVDVVHGERRIDNYFWMRKKEDPEVISYLNAENAYTDAVLKPLEGFQEALYKEILGRIKETDLSVPYRDGAYFYYSRTEEGKQYPIYCRKKESLDAAEDVMLDLNEMAKGEKFLSIGVRAVSDNGNLLAYTADVTGFREYTLYVKDLTTGKLGTEKIPKVQSAVWASDNRTIFYVTEDHAKRAHKLWRHRLGEASDTLLFEEKDELFRIGVYRSRSKSYIFLATGSFTTDECHYLRADDPGGAFRILAHREKDHEYGVDHHGDLFYIRSNRTGRNFSLLTAPVADPQQKNWKEIIPHREDVMLEDIDLFKDFYVLAERSGGLPQLRVTDFKSGAFHYVEFPEATYFARPETNREFEATQYRFNYESPITPSSVFDYDVAKRERKLLKQTEVKGGFDATKYQTERLHAVAPDGTRVPISIVYRKGLKRDGSSPLFLTAYGSYGYPMPAYFSSARLSLLDRGVTCALAHIRGGGDMGKKWHDQGRMMQKRNTFTDFIASAEYLAKEKYTSPDRLVIEGGSAGGLLMGAVTNMRPDLFKAVVSHVPFVDVLNTMLDASLPLTVGEYEEWGNPNIKEQYDYMKSYCPYTNLAAQKYPALLIKTSLNDSQVMYWEPAKYTAKLRTLKTDSNVLLLKTNMAGGHGGHSGRYDALKEVAFNFAFVLWQLGIVK
jgi:oligopeptidase B